MLAKRKYSDYALSSVMDDMDPSDSDMEHSDTDMDDLELRNHRYFSFADMHGKNVKNDCTFINNLNAPYVHVKLEATDDGKVPARRCLELPRKSAHPKKSRVRHRSTNLTRTASATSNGLTTHRVTNKRVRFDADTGRRSTNTRTRSITVMSDGSTRTNNTKTLTRSKSDPRKIEEALGRNIVEDNNNAARIANSYISREALESAEDKELAPLRSVRDYHRIRGFPKTVQAVDGLSEAQLLRILHELG